jgi:hypothetical protein
MKARVASVSVFVAGLALLLVAALGAKGSQVNAANPPSPNALPANNAGDPARTDRNPAMLSYTSILTFTPAFTTYLPLTARNFSPYGYHPGQILLDPEMDVSLACIDVIRMHSTLSETVPNSTLGGGGGAALQATFDLRDVPTELTFNRVGVPENHMEYKWSVYVDVDNDPQTGCPWDHYTGAEYSLGATHFVFSPDSPVTRPIPYGVQVNTSEYDSEDDLMHYLENAGIEVDAESDTMTLTGYIPEITTESRLFFVTYDYNPGGEPEWDESPGSTSAGQESQHLEFGTQRASGDGTVWRWTPIHE